MLHERLRLIDLRAAPGRPRARPALLVFLAGSAAAHAVVLGLLPGFERERGWASAAVLEVALLKASVPAAGPERPAAQPVPHVTRAERRPPAAALKLQDTTYDAPVAVMPMPRETERASFTVEPFRVPERALVAREPGESSAAAAQPARVGAAYLSSPAPSYPLASRRAGEQGTVLLRVRVASDGSAASVAVEQSSGSPHLDAAALEAVKAWRFRPARRGADAIESWMLVPVVFRLEGPS